MSGQSYVYEGQEYILPEGLTNEEAMRKIQGHVRSSEMDGQMAKIAGFGESVLGVGTSLLGGAAGGLRTLGELAGGADLQTALERSQSSSEAITYEPRTNTGKELTESVMKTLEDFQHEVGNKFAADQTGLNKKRMNKGTLTADDLAAENTERFFGEMVGGIYAPGLRAPTKRVEPVKPAPKPVNKVDALRQKLEAPTEDTTGAAVFDEMSGQLRAGEKSNIDPRTPDVMGSMADTLTKAAELKQKEAEVQAMWQELLAEKNVKKRAAMQADIAIAERQLAMEQEVARKGGLDFNAAERARQEAAPTGYAEHVAGQTGDRAIAATAEGLLDPATAAQRGIRAEGIPETRQGTETLYTDPSAQTFRGDPADPVAVLALERQKEAARNNLEHGITTTRGQPMDALTVDTMRKANEGPQLPWGEEGLQHQFKAELETQAVDNHPFVQAAERRLIQQEELVIKLKEQVKNGRAQASTLAREVKNLEHLEQALEKTKLNVQRGTGEGPSGRKQSVPFNFRKQGGGLDPEVFREGYKGLARHLSKLTDVLGKDRDWQNEIKKGFNGKDMMRNSDGTPMVMLHGTTRDIKGELRGSAQGFHAGFVSSPHQFTQKAVSRRSGIQPKRAISNNMATKENGQLHPVVIKEGNYPYLPFDAGDWSPGSLIYKGMGNSPKFRHWYEKALADKGFTPAQIDGFSNYILNQVGTPNQNRAFADILKRAGVDGFFYRNSAESPHGDKMRYAIERYGGSDPTKLDPKTVEQIDKLGKISQHPTSFVTWDNGNFRSIYDHTLGDKPKTIKSPGNRQQGAINPKVFEEGFKKIKRLADGTQLRATGNGAQLNVEIVRNGTKIGGAKFDPMDKDFFWMDPSDGAHKSYDAVSAETYVHGSEKGKGYATEMYKFVSELGNDVRASDTLTPDGQAMWNGFERKGFAQGGTIKSPGNKQKGALLIDPSKQKQGKFLEDNPALKLPSIVPERLTVDQVKEISKAVPDVKQTAVQKLINLGTKGGQYQALKVDHPIVKYTFDHINEADRLARGDIQTYVHDALGPATRALKKGTERTEAWEAANMADLLQKELTPQMLNELGFNENQINYIQTHRMVMDKAFEMANMAREAAGMKPITKRQGYAAMKATGDYRQLVYQMVDGERVVVGIVGSDFRPLLNHRAKKFLEKGYELGEVKYYGGVPKHVGDAQQALAQALEILAKDDPRVAEFTKVMEEVVTNEAYSFLNVKKHTLNKKGIFGMEGRKTEEGASPLFLQKLAEMNANEGLQSQLNYAEAMFKWGRLSEAVDAIKPVLSDPSIQAPNAKTWAEHYVQNALGYNPSKAGHFLEQAASELLGATGVGYSNVRYGMAVARKSVNTVLLALDPIFMGTNVVQPMKAMPGMKAYLVSKGLDANFDFGTGWSYIGKAAITEWKARTGKPLTEVEAGAYRYAKSHRVYGSDLVEQSNRASKDLAYRVDKAANFGLSNIESGTRQLMFFSFVDMLHQNGLSVKNGLYEAAHNLTDMTMNNYSPVERPPMYNVMGPVGDMAVNLSSFKHNEMSRIALFARQLAEEKTARPLLVELSSQIAWAGIKGIVAYEVADYLYRYITKQLGKPSSLSLEIIKMSEKVGNEVNKVTGAKKDGLGDARYVLSHGGFSMLGLDMSKRLGLGHVVGDNAVDVLFPGGSKIVDAGAAGAKALVDPTEMNVKRFASEIVPRPAATNMELEWFSKTKPSGEESAHNKRTLENTVKRTPLDSVVKRFGGTGIHESVEKEKLYQVESVRQAYADRRVKPLEHARDELFSTGKVSKETVQAYVKNEGDINTLIADINRLAKKQNMPAKDRELLKASMSRSITSLRHAQRLKEAYSE